MIGGRENIMTFEDLTALLLSWDLVEPAITYGTPSFKVRGKLLTRLKEDGDSILIKGVDADERDMLCAADPDLYYFTDHYRNHPMVLMRLSRANPDAVIAHLRRTYRDLLPAKRRQTLDLSGPG
jgi:hypothetical protein